MKDRELLRLHPTNAGGESGPTVGRFSSRDVLVIGAALLVGLMLYILAGTLNCSFAISVFFASIVPLVTSAILFGLAGKPAKFALHWLEWQWRRRRGTALIEHPYRTEDHDAD